ncbi:MAG: cytochrome b/b6 domain-containing protein [Perlucidibaca sp.]
MNGERLRVWDLPTRLFHWLLAAAVLAALATGLAGNEWMPWHGRCGLLIAALLAFRLVWGLLGSTYARFTTLLMALPAIPRYLRGQWQGAGHNPLGSLSVLAMLAMLAVQVSCGLFASDDIAFDGPLRGLVDSEAGNRFSGWHRQGAWLVMALVVLHLAAIFWHVRLRRHDLLRPMISGDTLRTHPAQQPARGGSMPALMLALIVAAAVAWGVSGSWLSRPAPAPVAAPAW